MARRSIRFRITAVAAIAVAAVLAATGAVLVVQQRRALTASLDQTLERRADDLKALLTDGDSAISFSSGPDEDEGFVQLVGENGAVIASTANLAGEPALPHSLGPRGRSIRSVTIPEIDDDVFRVLSLRVDVGVLHVGTAFEVVDEGANALMASLAFTIPGVVALLSVLVWWLVGRTLLPVEAIRSEVAAIGAQQLARRVPRPGTEDEVDRLAATMNEMLGRLESSVERQQRFVADASHELRSPLTRLRAELEVELAAAPDEPAADRLGSLLDEVVGMQAMVEDLLYLAQADARQTPRDAAPVDLDDVVIREGKRLSADRRTPIDLTSVSGAHVTGDRIQLSRAVKNLLDNAIRHAESRVMVSLLESEGWAVLTVTDDGPGIPVDGAELVFERFGRIDEARTAGAGGAGLGLAISREIIEQHGGTLSLLNPGEEGASFVVRLPLGS